ncbi:MAG TPA: hypothetical protein VMS92_18975 [Mycobacterium sp.]|nr:hypothetical protein [Mycobacterium sp.]
MWLGVDLSVDASGSVLIADIVQTLAFIDAAEVNAKAYTDAQILTRAPTVHTHTAAQVTDFNAAVDARIAASPDSGMPVGSIILYSGDTTLVGTGDWVSWHLCDGSDGTPDLRDRFVMGAGGSVNTGMIDPTNGKHVAGDLVVPLSGAHDHGGQSGDTTLTTAQMPVHNHVISGLPGTGTATSGGSHTHDITVRASPGPVNAGGVAAGNLATTAYTGIADNYAQADGSHTHAVAVNSNGSTNMNGSGTAHSHPIPSNAGHTHTVSAALHAVRDALNWFALAYIIKVA